MADTIAVMNKGRIERIGEPAEIYEDPRTAFVAGFLGASNLMEGQVSGKDSLVLQGGHVVRVGHGALAGRTGKVSIGVRPEKIYLSHVGADREQGNRLEGVLTDRSFIGVSTHYLVKTETAGELAVVVQNIGAERFTVGQSVAVTWSPSHSFVVGE